MSLRRSILSAALTLVGLVAAPSAHAYRTAGDLPDFDGDRVAWASGEIPYEIYGDVPAAFDISALERVAAESFSVWHGLECGGPAFVYGGTTSGAAAPNDGVNTVEWVTTGWAARGFPNAAAFTDIGYVRREDGAWEIEEADLYINGDTYEWILEGTPEGEQRTVASVLTHEAGHMLGLLHPCERGGHDGAPDCGSDGAFQQAAMYPFYESSRLELNEDDEAGVCFLYSTQAVPSEPGSNPPRTPDCNKDTDCRQGLRCHQGNCLRGTQWDGDPCEVHADCVSRECGDNGFCSVQCFDERGCSGDSVCVPIDNLGKVCRGGDLLGLGAPCDGPGQCAGARCVEPDEGTRFCSRTCDEDVAPCAAGWNCHLVDHRPVCVPDRHLASGGCGIAPQTATIISRSPSNVTGFVMAIVLLGFIGGRYRSGSWSLRDFHSAGQRTHTSRGRRLTPDGGSIA